MVIVLSGRFAGRKAVVLRVVESEEATKDRKFGHALIAGVDRYPRKVTKAMTAEQKSKRMHVKPFLKFVNLQHVMPTRYNLDISEQLDALVGASEDLGDQAERAAAKDKIKAKLEDRYARLKEAKTEKISTGVQYFFKKLCVGRKRLRWTGGASGGVRGGAAGAPRSR